MFPGSPVTALTRFPTGPTYRKSERANRSPGISLVSCALATVEAASVSESAPRNLAARPGVADRGDNDEGDAEHPKCDDMFGSEGVCGGDGEGTMWPKVEMTRHTRKHGTEAANRELIPLSDADSLLGST